MLVLNIIALLGNVMLLFPTYISFVKSVPLAHWRKLTCKYSIKCFIFTCTVLQCFSIKMLFLLYLHIVLCLSLKFSLLADNNTRNNNTYFFPEMT